MGDSILYGSYSMREGPRLKPMPKAIPTNSIGLFVSTFGWQLGPCAFVNTVTSGLAHNKWLNCVPKT